MTLCLIKLPWEVEQKMNGKVTNGDQEQGSSNIQAAAPGALQWRSGQVQLSLDLLLAYVEKEAANAIDWYWRSKLWKARLSRWIRLWALIFTACAGLVPIAFYILKDLDFLSDKVAGTSGLWSSALVGVAAALLGLDRAFGFSSGWARYVLAATDIRKRLEGFRMDWIALTALLGPNPSADQITALIQKAKEFRVAVEGIVAQETKDWVTEFQSNMAQLEKDVKAQLDSLKSQIDKTQAEREAATQPGSIEATVVNADQTKDFAFSVTLEGPDGVVAKDQQIIGGKTWGHLNVPPGQYRLIVTAIRVDGKPVSAISVIVVKPADSFKQTVTLPLELNK
jgi:hypothetical protein